MIILFSIGAFLATFLGGLFALRLSDRLHLILGFSAGAVIGVAFFDLMPEALALAGTTHSLENIFLIVAIGFALYMVVDRLAALHSHTEDDGHGHGALGAPSLALHSFLDGVGIGLAFHVSTTVGLVVALAVLVHDFSDGINTVSMVLRNGGSRAKAMRWLFVDALAPILGVVSTFFFTISESTLGLLLALFAGFFFYIGASDLLPESHHKHPVYWTTIASVLGMCALYAVIRIAG